MRTAADRFLFRRCCILEVHLALFFIPVRIHQIIVCYLLIQFFSLSRIYFFYELGRYAAQMLPGSITVLLKTNEPAATIAPSPITAWSRIVEPIPTNA